MFKLHKRQKLIFILSGISVFIVMLAYILESFGIDRLVLLFFILIAGLFAVIVLIVIILHKQFKKKKDSKNNNFKDYYKNLNRKRK